MLVKKSFMFTLALSIFMGGCSPSSSPESPPPKKALATMSSQALEDINQFMKLLEGPYPNLALAELMAQEIKIRNPEVEAHIKEVLQKQPIEWASISRDLHNEWRSSVREYILSGSPARQDDELLNKSIVFRLSELERNGSFSGRVQLQVAVMAKNEAFQRIMDAYNSQLKVDAQVVARELVAGWNKEQKNLIALVNGVQAKDLKQRAERIYQILIKYDYQLAKYEFSDKDRNRILVYTLVAGALASHLEEHPGVQTILETVQKVQDLKQRLIKMNVLLVAMDEYRQSLKQNWFGMASSFSDMWRSLDSLSKKLNNDVTLDLQSRRHLQSFIDGVLNGTGDSGEDLRTRAGKVKGILSTGIPLDKSVEHFVNSSTQTAKSLDQIMNTTEQIARLVGIELDPSIKQAIVSARKLTSGVKLVGLVAGAFEKEGLMGALSAFSGGPGLALLGIGGGGLIEGKMAADIGEIKKDIQEIKRLQIQTIELQKATIQMVRDLAIMIDESHRETMATLEEIREEVLAVKQMGAINNEVRLKICNSIIMFGYAGSPGSLNRYSGAHDIGASKQILIERAKGIAQIKNMVMGPAGNAATECALGMSAAFAEGTNHAFLLRHYYGISDGDGAKIDRKLFTPAREYLEKVSLGKSVDEMALHLPVIDVKTLKERKAAYIYDGSGRRGGGSLAEIADLIAPVTLEKFVATLVAIHPFISLESSDWATFDLAMKSATDVSAGTPVPLKRSQEWLKGALNNIKTAIAQEAILSGEPLLPALADQWPQIMAEKSACLKANEEPFCFVRANSIMMKNLIIYWANMYMSPEDLENGFSCYLDEGRAGVAVTRFTQKDGKCYLQLGKLQVELPPIDKVSSGTLIYTETMARLIKLQQAVADELMQVSPHALDQEQVTKLKYLLLSK